MKYLNEFIYWTNWLGSSKHIPTHVEEVFIKLQGICIRVRTAPKAVYPHIMWVHKMTNFGSNQPRTTLNPFPSLKKFQMDWYANSTLENNRVSECISNGHSLKLHWFADFTQTIRLHDHLLLLDSNHLLNYPVKYLNEFIYWTNWLGSSKHIPTHVEEVFIKLQGICIRVRTAPKAVYPHIMWVHKMTNFGSNQPRTTLNPFPSLKKFQMDWYANSTLENNCVSECISKGFQLPINFQCFSRVSNKINGH